MNWPFGDIRPFSADLISVDFPWAYDLYSEAGAAKSASAQYDVMTLDEILSFAPAVSHLASGDCLCLMWGCEWMLPAERQRVLEAMGFTYKTAIMWRKTTRKGKVRMGVGYRARTMHEPVYLGTIGNPQHKAFPSVFDGVAREHSRKPDEFFKMVERCMPQARKLDLFSRQSRPGWVNWGRESTLFDVEGSAPTKREIPAPVMPALEPMSLFPNAA